MSNQKTVIVEVIVDWNGNLDSHKNFQNLIIGNGGIKKEVKL